MTITYQKVENKNQIKCSLIIEFLYKLKTLIKNKKETNVIPKNLNISKNEILPCLPCLATDCYLLQYLKYFLPTINIFLLPIYTKTQCEICYLVETNKLKLSDIKVTKNQEVLLKNQKLKKKFQF